MNLTFELKLIKYRNLKQILESTVKTAREILKCDRVIIYTASNLPQAEVLAESGHEKCVSLLGQTIQDPFLAGDYLEMYCYGMSLTIDNIHASDVNQSKLAELEQMGVKSVAIAPIYVDNKILAFLVAHQCFQLQPWDEQTVNLLAEKAGSAGKALSAIVQGDELAEFILLQQMENNHSNQNDQVATNGYKNSQRQQIIEQEQNKLFADIKDKLSNQLKQKNILTTIVADIRQLLKCDRVLIYSLNIANYGVVIAESVADGWTKILAQTANNSQVTTQYLEEDRDGKVRVWHNTHDEDAPSWYREQLEALNVKAGLVAPIANNGQLFGLLIAHQCSNTRNWQQHEINWITQIANQISNMPEYTQISNGNQQEQKEQITNFQQQLEQERMWTKHFFDVLQQIRQSFKIQDILKSSVREIQRILKCDRVLVYALNHNSYGKIVAESVTAGWTKAEGMVIKDPCFEARYLAKYRDGRVRAWNNIYEAGIGKCYIEQLERLEVKANLVVPMIIEGKLFGLLVAHQCSQPRRWQKSEILWLTQIATQVGFALDNAQLLADAQRLRLQAESEKMWTEYFTDAVQQIRQSLKPKDVLKASVREVKRVLNCDRVLVYALDQDNYGKVVAESVTHGWTRAEGRVIKDPCFEAKYLDQYRDGRVRAWENIYEAGMSNCYVEQLAQLEVKANLVTPIINQGKLFGLLVAHQCSDTRQWQEAEIRWMSQIAAQVGLALDNAQLIEKIEQYTQDTQAILDRAANSSSNIKRTVQNVTVGFENLSNSCQTFAETIGQVKDLSKQLAQQSMGMARVMNSSQLEPGNQDSAGDLSERIFTLMQELFETTARIDPLFTSIKTEITAKTTTLESETGQLMSGVDDFATASQNLEQIVALNHEMSNLIKNISDSLDSQIQSSTFTKNSVHELTDITKRISLQSVAIIKSLNQRADFS